MARAVGARRLPWPQKAELPERGTWSAARLTKHPPRKGHQPATCSGSAPYTLHSNTTLSCLSWWLPVIYTVDPSQTNQRRNEQYIGCTAGCPACLCLCIFNQVQQRAKGQVGGWVARAWTGPWGWRMSARDHPVSLCDSPSCGPPPEAPSVT